MKVMRPTSAGSSEFPACAQTEGANTTARISPSARALNLLIPFSSIPKIKLHMPKALKNRCPQKIRAMSDIASGGVQAIKAMPHESESRLWNPDFRADMS
jgi:hypothetical protein